MPSLVYVQGFSPHLGCAEHSLEMTSSMKPNASMEPNTAVFKKEIWFAFHWKTLSYSFTQL